MDSGRVLQFSFMPSPDHKGIMWRVSIINLLGFSSYCFDYQLPELITIMSQIYKNLHFYIKLVKPWFSTTSDPAKETSRSYIKFSACLVLRAKLHVFQGLKSENSYREDDYNNWALKIGLKFSPLISALPDLNLVFEIITR